MRKIDRIIYATIAVALFITVSSGCKKTSEKQSILAKPFASFRDIPGVTGDEIKAVEAFQKQNRTFSYGMAHSTEAFVKENGEIGGYAVLFCEWLTGLFQIPFHIKLYEWGDLLEKLNNRKIDFMGELKETEEHRKIYYMSDPINKRIVKIIRIEGSQELSRIALSRPLRYAFLKDADTFNEVSGFLKPGSNETFFVNDYETVHQMLVNGKIDAFISENVDEAAFDRYGDAYTEDFLPLVFSSASLATRNPALAPIVSVVTKALRNGGIQYLNEQYNRGYDEYQKNKFSMLLNNKEKAYMQNPPIVPILAENWFYPLNYYNKYEERWEGIAFDVLAEVTRLTGLTFKVANEPDTSWADMYKMMQDGEAVISLDMIYTEERKNNYLWSKYPYLSETYALLSKQDFPNISIADIQYAKIGLIKSTGYAETFQTWFPHTTNTTVYETQDDAFMALDNNKVDLIMAGTNALSSVTNYYELSNYKANFLFNSAIDYILVFNKNETILSSIVDKALSLIDIKTISKQWESKTFDYQSKLMRAQRPWLIGTSVLSLSILALVSVLLIISRNSGKRLEKLVKQRTGELQERTSELELRTEEAKSASRAKSAFLANMSHEMRTPMNVVVGLTDLMLEDDNPTVNLKDNLKKISAAGSTLLGLINDVLDISKIEAGRLELTPVEYEMPSLLNDIIILNIIRIESKPIAFRLDINEDLPYSLYGDDLRIKQIINNLLSNAFKYTQKGAVTLGISCEHGDAEDVWMSVYVSDTGIGIRQEDLDKLFVDYNQVDLQANRRIEGTGLGLSITKMLVEHMNGEISVESEYGKSTTFRLRIRQGYVSDKTIDAETAKNLRSFRYAEDKRKAAQKLVRPDLSYAKVLVVDDMPNNLDVSAALLGKYKMQVDCVSSGQEAIDRINDGEPVYDAIFMDHMMPGMDGVEATVKIRAIGTKYAMTIPIIALTANAIAGNEQMFLNNDFQAFLAKPINVIGLDVIVQRWVRDKSRE